MKIILLLLVAFVVAGCEFEIIKEPVKVQQPIGEPTLVDLSPRAITLHRNQQQQFVFADTIIRDPITWTIVGGPGTISSRGLYTVPSQLDADTVRFWIEAMTGGTKPIKGRARVTIVKGHDFPVCYEQEIEPIMRSHCALSGCHDLFGKEHGYDLSSYEGVMQGVTPGDPSRSIIYVMMVHPDVERRMPPPPRTPMTDRQIELVRHWIADGAVGAPCPGEEACDTAVVTYSGTIRSILDDACTSCHNPTSPENGDIDLTTYAGVSHSARSGAFLGSVSHAAGYARMPNDSTKLSTCRIRQIQRWIDNGAPEN